MFPLRLPIPVRAAVVALVLAGSLAASASACPNCTNGMAGHGNLVSGYFYSIIFMMSMPFLILGTLAGGMYLAIRKARAERQREEAERDVEAAELPAEDTAPEETVVGTHSR